MDFGRQRNSPKSLPTPADLVEECAAVCRALIPCCGEIRGGKLDTEHPSFVAKLRTSILAVAIAALGAATAFGAAPLNSIGAIHRLTNDEAAKQIPVDFEATVTFYR